MRRTMSITGNNPTADVAAVSLLGDLTRRRLYEWVADQGRDVGREEAAQAVGITRALATFHLDRLAAAGLLEGSYRRLSGRSGPGAGRPARVYRRAARDFAVELPQRQYGLAADLFASTLESLGGGGAPTTLTDAARATGEQMANGRELLTVLDTSGYEPSVDADGTIRLRNCPFDALVGDHRQLVCGTNLALGEGIVNGAGASGYCAVADPQPGYCCVAFATRDGWGDSKGERVSE
jgi:predicted ArsR family transcriptional regulator